MRLIKIIERLLVRVTLMGLVVLVAVQTVTTGSFSSMLDFSVPSRQIADNQMVIGQNIGEKSVVIFSLVDYTSLAQAAIYVNGKKRADFAEKYAAIAVYPGDLVELDASFYEKPVFIQVMQNDRKVIKLKEGTIIRLRHERKALPLNNVD